MLTYLQAVKSAIANMTAPSNATLLLTLFVEFVAMQATWLETVRTDNAELTGAMVLRAQLYLAVLLLDVLVEVTLSTVNTR